ncbi:MAG: two-component sensor histidine kinase [Myxococcales bacterium]|nr:two-component sensor histidine kinase [Myxococcales bacterium]
MAATKRRSGIRGRLILATVAWVAAASALALGLLYAWGRTLPQREVDVEVQRELEELVRQHRELGAQALGDELTRRISDAARGHTIYLYAESELSLIRGNLDSWPGSLLEGPGGETLELEAPGSGYRVLRQIRIAAIRLDDGRRLAVGRDISEHARFERALMLAGGAAFLLAVLGALGAGLRVSNGLLGRVEEMSRTILAILAGRRQERVRVRSAGDEFDGLAAHFNQLLNENEHLLARMREVTDDVAHDLRTPLARIRTHAESALATPEDPARMREALHELLEETNRLLEVFNALLAIAQIESHQLREHMQALDLAAQAETAAELYQPVAEEAGFELRTELEPGLTVRADRHLLAQTASNLIDNAIKYGRAPGVISVETLSVDGRPELRVSDQGPGIPEADRERVLGRFVRLDASRSLPGTGLGLSFVAAVADLHDAELRLEDNAPGLRVRLSFPAARPAPGKHPPSRGRD